MDMFKERFPEWLKAAGIRALKTTAQALAAGIGTTAVLSEIDWPLAVSTALVAGILSLLTSIGGLPELKRASD
ncbi:MAG: holin [Clostridium sp.]|nr:holin [Clostridium sp.]